MESKSHLSASSNRTSDMQTDVSSAIEPKSNFQIDGSSTPMESKGQAPTSIDRMSATETDGYLVIERNSTTQTDGESPMKTNEKSHAPSMIALKHTGKILASSAMQMKTGGKAVGSSVIETKPHGKAAVVSGNDVEVMGFYEVTLGPHEAELRFRLIHFWEARNPHTKTLIGEEMLLIDEQGNVIKGFIPASRVQTYLRKMTSGTVYRLNRFFGSRNKAQYRVADHNVTVTFSWNTVLTPLQNSPILFPEDQFRFHDHEEFEANCDLRGDLYDYVGHMRLINGQAMTEHLIIDESDIVEKRHLVVHVQTHGGPVMKLYLWDQAATVFCQKFKSYGSTPRVLLVTTMNPKRIGGTLALTSMTSSRVFMDIDVQPTRDYLDWLGSNSGVANEVIADVVTKPETVTLGELYSYIKQETAKVAWFECTATIDDVLHGSPWYYISCGGCNTKATKGPTSLVCTNKKCTNSEVVGVPQYLTKISVYDKSEQAVFVLLGDAGRELTGKHASELVARYFEFNEDVGADQTVPVPQTLIDTIGQTHKFVVKVSKHNLTGKTQTITVTKVLPEPAPQNAIEDPADERIRKASDSLESQEAKRAKSG
ncbi:BnaC03g60940D [Brassica napus]|uniref:BnaC03g60940D protein n=1 Tax=Brassica napus TaxID=3708 RepID=A0A078HQ43_BRANA|nr:BnaC03g60940D [Brassica napus]